MGLFSGLLSLNSNKPSEEKEGALDLLPELKLSMDDGELISLKKDWEKIWNQAQPKIHKAREENEKYWLGNQFSDVEGSAADLGGGEERPLVDNKLFEALETFLPIATRQNPDPIVSSDDTDEGKALADKVRKMHIYQADRLRLKLRVKRAARYWALYFLGVAKVGWSFELNDITTEIIRPQKLILDPTATINDDMEYTGEFIGYKKIEKASSLILKFPKSATDIEAEVKGQMGTKVNYVEWWTDDFVFWTMKDEVLGKAKNPHWNEEGKEPVVDKYGKKTKKTVAGNNHFIKRKKPFVFLSVFNLGKTPFDETSLISQNLALQDVINKRQRQIDKNVDGMNGGWVVSGEYSGLTKDQATEAIQEARKGGGLYVEQGDPNRAVARLTGGSIPSDVFHQLADSRLELQNLFGVAGSTAEGIKSEETVRGKIITRAGDASRIGGGITEYIEQFIDQIYNWWTQLYYVYYTEEKTASILGEERASEFITLKNTELNKELTVSVKEGSLIPRDPMIERNEAVDLYTAGAMDLITLYEKLDFPNPRRSAERAFMQQAAPELLFKENRETEDVGQAVMRVKQENAMEEEATRRALAPEPEVVPEEPPVEETPTVNPNIPPVTQ